MNKMEPNTERYEHTDRRIWQAFYILATMTIASAIVCCFGPWIAEYMLYAAVGTHLGAGIGTMIFMVIAADHAIRQTISRR